MRLAALKIPTTVIAKPTETYRRKKTSLDQFGGGELLVG
jgi:hypothetical protein